MKSRYLSVLLITIVSSSAAFSQVHKGVYSLAGMIGFSSTTNTGSFLETRVTTFTFSPGVSYFIIDELEITLSPSLQTMDNELLSSEYHPAASSSSSAASLTLGFRYYYALGRAALFVGPSGGLTWSKPQGRSFLSPVTTYMIEGGADIFIVATTAIEPSVRYSSTELSSSTTTDISVGIGVRYFIL